LNASAVAVALTEFPVRPQTREKYTGRPDCVTFTVTTGFTPKPEPKVEQSLLRALALPTE
jgi:hypothetical protein